MNELEKYIQTYFGVDKDDLTKISSFFYPITLKKGDYFLKTGMYSAKRKIISQPRKLSYFATS